LYSRLAVSHTDDVTAASILDGQMGQARWVSTGTARKSTALARHGHDAIALVPARGTSAWAAGPARSTSTGTTRLMSRHDGGTIILINLIFLAAHDAVTGTRASRPPSR
jgi:hypothetical protein